MRTAWSGILKTRRLSSASRRSPIVAKRSNVERTQRYLSSIVELNLILDVQPNVRPHWLRASGRANFLPVSSSKPVQAGVKPGVYLLSGFEVWNDLLINITLRFFTDQCHLITVNLHELVSVERRAVGIRIRIQNCPFDAIPTVCHAIY